MFASALPAHITARLTNSVFEPLPTIQSLPTMGYVNCLLLTFDVLYTEPWCPNTDFGILTLVQANGELFIR